MAAQLKRTRARLRVEYLLALGTSGRPDLEEGLGYLAELRRLPRGRQGPAYP